MFALRYKPGTWLGERYPEPSRTRWRTAEAADALRLACINAEHIEVVEVGS